MSHAHNRPVIYQLLPRLFGNLKSQCVPNGSLEVNGCGRLSHITDEVLGQIAAMGFTHVWYTGVIEHAHTPDYTAYGIPRHSAAVIKGQAGSPYAITDYYSIDPDLVDNPSKRMAEFEALIQRTHARGMKVLIDFVPNHVSRLYHSTCAPKGVKDLGADDDKTVFFSPDNNFYYLPGQELRLQGVDQGDYIENPARATGNDCYTASPGPFDWYETVKLNYGRNPQDGRPYFSPIPSTWIKMRDILLYWAGKGVDGWRCDMVHMVPLEFWNWVIPQVKARHKDVIFIGELYDVSLYRPYIQYGGFDYLYDKVVLYDTLRDIQKGRQGADHLTQAWQKTDGLGAHMLDFLENHDEQRFASPQYAGDAAQVLPSLVLISTINTGAVMIYAGQELGETGTDAEGYSGPDGRTTIFDYWSIPTLRRWLTGQSTARELQLRDTYTKVLRLINDCEAIREGGFYDLMYANYDNPGFNPWRQWAYLRHSQHQTLLIAVNFDGQAANMQIRIPSEAFNHCGLRERGLYRGLNLFDGTQDNVYLTCLQPVEVTVPAHGATVLQLQLIAN